MGRAPLPMDVRRAQRQRASCKISIGGQDVTGKLSPHLLQVTITKSQSHIGEAHIELDDRYGMLKLPTSDDDVFIELGWPGEGSFKVFAGKPADVISRGQRRRGRTVTIKVEESGLMSPIKTAMMGSWGTGQPDGMVTFEEVARDAAKVGGVEIYVDPKLAQKKIPSYSANGEPVMSFMQRLAREANGKARLTEGRVEFIDNETEPNASASITCRVGTNVLAWNVRPRITRPVWKSVGRVHFDPVKAKWMEEKRDIDQGGGFFGKAEAGWRDMIPAASEADAKLRNASDASDAIQKRGDGWVMIDGEPRAEPFAKAIISGARDGVDGNYTIDEVEHSYSRQTGFTTRLDLTNPNITPAQDGKWEQPK